MSVSSDRSGKRARRGPLAFAISALASLSALATGGAILLLGLLFISAAHDLPDLDEHPPAHILLSSIVYSADGVELGRFHREHRVPVKITDVHPSLVEALVATEDRRFYSHTGVDGRRIIAAAWQTLRGNPQGGSTLPMQLARNRYPEIAEASLRRRKALEMMLAWKLERGHEKDELIELYLNTVPFGQRAFGIAAAARVYFRKAASELTVEESALLVGALKGTTWYNPARNPERARQRRNVVLSQMEQTGYIASHEADSLRRLPIELAMESPLAAHSPAPHFTEYVRKFAETWTEEQGMDLYADGLRIHTTLDSRLQRHAQRAAERQLYALQKVAAYEWSAPQIRFLGTDPTAYARQARTASPFSYLWEARPEVLSEAPLPSGSAPGTEEARMDSARVSASRLQGGLVSIEPATGHVKAWVGSRDFSTGQFDYVAQARRQAGSTFKPFIWAAAVDRGYGPEDRWADGAVVRETSETRNSGVSLRRGLARSSNPLAQHLTDEMTPHVVTRTARQLGISTPLRPFPSIAMGTSEVTLLELTSAYGTLANGGRRTEPLVVTRIEDHSGNVLARFEPVPTRAISAHTSYSVLDMMRAVVDEGTGRDIRRRFGITGADLAGKTGTTQKNADGWFVMAHPQLVTGAWVGFNDRRVAFRSEHWGRGSSNALRLVGDLTRQAMAGGLLIEEARFVPPAGHHAPETHRHASWENGQSEIVQRTDGEEFGDYDTASPTWRDSDPEQALRQSLREMSRENEPPDE